MRRLFQRRSDETSEGLDISPLIDMVFILLIFFVVTSTFTRETGVDVDRPQAASAREITSENILIAITREGTIHIHERQVSLDQLAVIVQRLAREDPERNAVIISDTDTRTGAVVQVIDACNRAGIRKVSIGAMRD